MLRRPLRGDRRGFAPWTHTQGISPVNPRGKTSRLAPFRSPIPAHCLFRRTAAPQFRRPPRHNTTARRTRPLSQREQQRITAATTRAYFRFCNECSAYHHSVGNYLMLMDWIDERRIEMQAEGRRYWVPSIRDFEQAMRDCWDDLARA
jgi:hypothetical protein